MSATPLVGKTFFGLDISQLGDQLLSIRRRVSKRVLLLDFSQGALTLAEASLSQAGVQLDHVSRLDLPEEALDRGVPAEPAKMAALIQVFCTEKKIPAHRSAVVLPPDVAFQRLIELPSDLTTDQAREYVIDPANGLQIPFPLIQTDFDLCPVLTPTKIQIAAGMRLYMLSAVPQMMVDRVVEMMQLADLELQILELGHHTLLRALSLDLVLLSELEVDLVLELLSDASHLMLVTSSGLLGSERLAPIREFPAPALDEEQVKTVLENGKSAEAYVVEDDNYLPLSDLDLRVLVADLKAALRRFYQRYPVAEVRCLRLSGLNSSHPGLVELLHDALGVHVELHRPLLVNGVAGFSSSDCLLQASLGRLVGLGLGLLPAEQLSTCPVDAMRSEMNPVPEKSTALVDLLDQPQIKSDLDLIPVVGAARVDSNRLALGQTKIVDVMSELSTDNDSASHEIIVVEDDPILREVPPELDDSQQWSSIVSGEEQVEEEELKGEVMDETEWPSIAGGEEKAEEEELKGEVMDETEWPSIAGRKRRQRKRLEGGVMDETEWPSIAAGREAGEEG